VNSQIDNITKLNQELVQLALLENPTAVQSRRLATVKGAIDSLKAGFSMHEIYSAEREQLRQYMNLPRAPESCHSSLGMELDEAWRKWTATGERRATAIPSEREVRANIAGGESITTTALATGDAFVPIGMHDRALFTMKQHNQIFEPWASNRIETNTGAPISIAVADDTPTASVQLGQSNLSGEIDVQNFGQVLLNSYTFRSKVVAVSLELLQDSNFNIGATLERIFAVRHALGVGTSFVTGAGAGTGPTGILPATIGSGAVPVIANGSSANDGSAATGANSIGTGDIFSLYKKLDPILRQGACFLMSDNTLRAYQSLNDKQGRPLFPNGLVGDESQPTLLGHRVVICNSMPSVSAASNSVIFYQPTYYVTRTQPSASYVRRFWENATLVQYGLLGFESYFRCDSNLVAPNVNYLPSQYLQHHS
jgi:HK97 family phage major capsid protein